MSACLPAGVSHLLVADDSLRPGWSGASQIAVCGVLLDTASSGVEDPGYCPDCVTAAQRWSATSPARWQRASQRPDE